MERRRLVAALVAATAGGLAVVLAMATPGVARPRAGVSPPAELRLVGSNSCAARGCHGAVGPTSPASGDVYIRGGAATTWRYYDPHARSFAVLGEARSLEMARKLMGTIGTTPPSESRTCLVCHATDHRASATEVVGIERSDGVSCESCHGPAGSWEDAHLSPGFRNDPAARSAAGMADLSDAAGRARTCVGCHVGDRSRGMDVNHDLIAAGHPRLNFEYSAYLEAYPKHWKERPGASPDLAGDWAVGQAVTAGAALRLLADRAGSSAAETSVPPATVAPWPELSESECFSCHHSLANPGWSPDRGAFAIKPGRLPWATWTSAMLPELEKVRPGWKLDAAGSPWAELRAEMGRKAPDASKVSGLAARSADLMDDWLKAPSGKAPTPAEVVSIARRLVDGWPARPESWDQCAQRTMAVGAMVRAGKALGVAPSEWKEVAEGLDGARVRLGFPRGFDSPIGGRPTAAPGR